MVSRMDFPPLRPQGAWADGDFIRPQLRYPVRTQCRAARSRAIAALPHSPRGQFRAYRHGPPIGVKRVVLVPNPPTFRTPAGGTPKKFQRRRVSPASAAQRGSPRRGAAQIPDADAQSQVRTLARHGAARACGFDQIGTRHLDKPDARNRPYTPCRILSPTSLPRQPARLVISESGPMSRRDQKSRHQEGVNSLS